MGARKEAITEAVEAACRNVWDSMWAGQMGEWPNGCPDPDLFRAEEREALEPALQVLERKGWLRTDPDEPKGNHDDLDMRAGR